MDTEQYTWDLVAALGTALLTYIVGKVVAKLFGKCFDKLLSRACRYNTLLYCTSVV